MIYISLLFSHVCLNRGIYFVTNAVVESYLQFQRIQVNLYSEKKNGRNLDNSIEYLTVLKLPMNMKKKIKNMTKLMNHLNFKSIQYMKLEKYKK